MLTKQQKEALFTLPEGYRKLRKGENPPPLESGDYCVGVSINGGLFLIRKFRKDKPVCRQDLVDFQKAEEERIRRESILEEYNYL